MFEVLETAKKVAAESLQVEIDEQALVRLSKRLIEKGINLPPWENLYHFYDGGEKTVCYLLVLDTLNFCFWPAPGEVKWEIEYNSGKLSGYYALAVSLKQAVESGIPITRADYLAELSLSELKEILGGRGELQLPNQRVQNLNELGKVLLEEYHVGGLQSYTTAPFALSSGRWIPIRFHVPEGCQVPSQVMDGQDDDRCLSTLFQAVDLFPVEPEE